MGRRLGLDLGLCLSLGLGLGLGLLCLSLSRETVSGFERSNLQKLVFF